MLLGLDVAHPSSRGIQITLLHSEIANDLMLKNTVHLFHTSRGSPHIFECLTCNAPDRCLLVIVIC